MAGLQRLIQSPVVWSWAFQGLRLASGLILLPLVLNPSIMSKGDMGMYFLLLDLMGLAFLFDFGFSPSVGRNVSYAMAGVTHLKGEGLVEAPPEGTPNYPLLWQLLDSTRRLFMTLSGLALVVLGAVGTWMVASTAGQTSRPDLTWIAWGLVLASSVIEIYAGWWNTFLRSLNQVLPSARIATFTYGLRLILAAGLLLAGAGLTALPIAGLVSSVLHRQLSKRRCLQFLGARPASVPETSLTPVLWPNSWRTGLQFLSVYLATRANTLICARFLGLEVNASYGLTAQVVQLISSMAMVWCSVKWPIVGQLARLDDLAGLKRLLWPRIWMQSLTFLLVGACAVPVGPQALQWLESDRQLLPSALFIAMLAYGFLETQFAFWTTLLSLMLNRIPSLWPTVATNALTLFVVLSAFRVSGAWGYRQNEDPQLLGAGLAILAFTPLLVACLFNFWFWPMTGARQLKTRWLRFMLTGR